jgi:hypothetical protein
LIRITSLLITILCLFNSCAQKPAVSSEQLSSKQIVDLFTDDIRKKLNITLPIFKVYKYSDKSGQFYCVLTESRTSITEENDTLNNRITAINFRFENGNFTKSWEINDNIIKEKDETSVWFMTKYVDFKDYDGDGLGEPIIIYGSAGLNGRDDGRVKFIIYYKGQKIAIRHQNGTLDYERVTQLDKSVYTLPESMLESIRQKMMLMEKNGHTIFPASWQTDMDNKKTKWDNL